MTFATQAAPLARRKQQSVSLWQLLSSTNVAVTVAPAAVALLLLSAITGGAGGVTVLAVLRAIGYWTVKQGRRISRRLSNSLRGIKAGGRRISGQFSPLALQQGAGLRAAALGSTFTLLLVRALYKLRGALRDYDYSVPLHELEDKLDPELIEKAKLQELPLWGTGFPGDIPEGVWKPFLWSDKTAQENLEEIRNGLGLWRSVDDISIDQLTEGVRRQMQYRFQKLVAERDGRYWTEDEARRVALALAADCGLPTPLPTGGLEECVPLDFLRVLPWHTPKPLQVLQCSFFKFLRGFFHAALSFKSRFVKTPYGMLHVLDSRPDEDGVYDPERPPLLLQHGAFVTGWSMMLLGWLLGWHRRVVVPDLFDFEYGFSISDGWKNGKPVRHVAEHIESLMCVVRYMQSSTRGQAIDISGHSYGGFLTGVLANRCEKNDLPIRKVVLLAPGGPPSRITATPHLPHLMFRPMEFVEEVAPRWAPVSLLKMMMRVSLGIMLSPNNCNTLLGLEMTEYLGGGPEVGFSTTHPTMLLWGDKDTVACPRDEAPLAGLMKANFPSIEAFWVRGGFHNIQFDSAWAIAEQMEAFLNPRGAGGNSARSGSIWKMLLWFTNSKVYKMAWSDDKLEPAGNVPIAMTAASLRSKM